MMCLVLLSLFVVLCYVAADPIVANMNEYMDLVMEDAAPWIIKNGLDPLRLIDISKQFEYKPMLATYHGHVRLTEGLLHNLRNISRSGNSIMHYDYKLLRIETEVSMTNLNFRYDYDVSVMDLRPQGWIDGTITNINVQASVIVDLVDFIVYTQEFRVTSIGALDIKVHGNTLIDWLGNVMIKVITSVFKSTIVEYVSGKIHEMAQITIDGINNRLSIYDRREMAAIFFNDIEIKPMLPL